MPKNMNEEKLGVLDLKVEVNENIAIDMEMHYIELPKFIEKNPECANQLEQWLWVFSDEEDKIDMVKEKNEKIKRAMEIVEEMSLDEKEWQAYQERQDALKRYNTQMIYSHRAGEEKGREEGTKNEKKRIAREMVQEKVNIETISKITGLTKQQIEELKND